MNDKIKNGKAVIKEEEGKSVKAGVLTQVKELAWKHKWKIARILAKEVYENWDVIEPHLATWIEFIKALFS